ncbi:hypothetical protein DOY81_007169, partial [Sarcophaga bullata]
LAKILLASVAIVLLFSSVQAKYSPQEYCSLVPVGTKLPDLGDCHQYYTCVSPNEVNAAKCPNNQVFNKDSQSCITTPNGSCDEICENQHEKWVPDPIVCGKWYYCKNGNNVGYGHCKDGQYLDYDKQTCRNGQCSGGVSNICLIMQSGQFFGDFNDCKTWHKCDGLQIQSGTCPDTIYNSEKRQCVQSNGNTCGRPTEKCPKEGAKSPDPEVCSKYFECSGENSNWMKQSCPKGQFYDVTLKTCKSRQEATPVSTCDRCEYSTSAWVNAVDPLCRKYLFCSKGVKIDEAKCTKGFFDEQLQRCSAGSEEAKKEYSSKNGACAAPPSPQPPGSETPGTGSETPGTGSETPGTGSETPGTGSETPGTGSETPGTGSETPGTETPGTGSETPGTGSETPGTGSETPGTGSETPGTGSETPGT